MTNICSRSNARPHAVDMQVSDSGRVFLISTADGSWLKQVAAGYVVISPAFSGPLLTTHDAGRKERERVCERAHIYTLASAAMCRPTSATACET